MPRSLSACYAACERLARREAANFYPAFCILPRPQRLAMCALYAFLRLSDDLADEPGETARKRLALRHWRGQLLEALSGSTTKGPLHPVLTALADTVRRHAIPHDYLLAALDGVESDLDTVHLASLTELLTYCYRVASVVGLSCIHIWDYRSEAAKPLAVAAGIAFQLTNILRDLDEDRQRGRVYLPADELLRFGVADPLTWTAHNLAFRDLMRFQTQRIHAYYRQAEPLMDELDAPGRAVFSIMMRTYRGLLETIEARDFDVFSQRIRVGTWRKIGFVLRALPIRWGLAFS